MKVKENFKFALATHQWQPYILSPESASNPVTPAVAPFRGFCPVMTIGRYEALPLAIRLNNLAYMGIIIDNHDL
ncbi:hypothetical protein [Cohnella abietis]|uniref:hypothetical protein n=1 Tax=Cohnella abietis TaxID=2507935 RepID=UPI0013900C66|nr:hypothetical protein [Cohnella abietis]